MPDQFNFDHLGGRLTPLTLACIEEGCGLRGPAHVLTEGKRRQHHRSHEASRQREAKRRRQQAAAHARRMARLAARENALAQQLNGGRS